VNWQTRELLLGECKWGEGSVDRATVRELLERKAPRMRDKMGDEWTFNYAFFARSGFTEAATDYAYTHKVLLVTADQIATDLQQDS
jgi:hypothetical protein